MNDFDPLEEGGSADRRAEAEGPEHSKDDDDAPRPMALGRTLGVDLGDRAVGLALSDPLGLTAQGLPTMERKGDRADVVTLHGLCTEREVTRVVLGLPRNMDGSEGPRAAKSRAFALRLREEIALPVFLWDERLSTAEAERILIAADVSRHKRKTLIDRLSAQVILQGYLDAGQPEHDPA